MSRDYIIVQLLLKASGKSDWYEQSNKNYICIQTCGDKNHRNE